MIALLVGACSVSQSESIDMDPFEIPQGNYYEESEVEIPSDAQTDAVEFESARINYEIESSNGDLFGDGEVLLSVYVSSRETADDERDEPADGDEHVFTVTLESEDDLGTGSANSNELVDILNSGQDRFVVALDVEKENSVPFFDSGELTLDLELVIDYSVGFF